MKPLEALVKGYKETSTLSLGLTGCLRKNWQEGDRISSFFDLKGVVEIFLKKLNLVPVFMQSKREGFLNCVEIKLNNESSLSSPCFSFRPCLDFLSELSFCSMALFPLDATKSL